MYYRICVRGHLDPSWQERFAGLRLEQQEAGTTLLSGELPDQAALHGVLLQITRLGLVLLSLETSAAKGDEEAAFTRKKDWAMHESSQTQCLRDKNVVVVGGSRGLGRAIVAAAHAEGAQVLAVARKVAELGKLTEELSGVQALALDATSQSAPAKVFATLSPDVLVVCAGAIPHMAPLGEQSWEQFSRNWNTDVKLSLLFCQAALNTPLPAGTTIILISSGAAIGGSPLSGGYAGAKRTQMFLASYAQAESNHRSLGLRFLAMAPGGNILSETELGSVAASAYATARGVFLQDFIRGQRGQNPQVTTELVANAVIELASQSQGGEGDSFLVSGAGVTMVS